MITLIAKNITNNNIILDDIFGITIFANSEHTLTDNINDYSTITNSSELKEHVHEERIILNNGEKNLSVSEGLLILQFATQYSLLDHIATSQIINSGKDISFNFSCWDTHYYKFKGHSWELASHFIFSGTNRMGTPSGVYITAYSKHNHPTGTPGGYIRLFDLTNNNVICEWSIRTNSVEIYSDESIINMPAEQAIFEIQGKKGACSETFLTSILLKF